MTGLTAPQIRVLRILLADQDTNGTGRSGATAAGVAREMWPDSKAWNRRTNRGSTAAGGALGATMPMKAATMLHRLAALGLVSRYHPERGYLSDNLWWITPEGVRALTDLAR